MGGGETSATVVNKANAVHSENTCTLTFHSELGLCAVMEGFAAVGASVGCGQFVDSETVFEALVFECVLGSRVDEHSLPHPLNLP